MARRRRGPWHALRACRRTGVRLHHAGRDERGRVALAVHARLATRLRGPGRGKRGAGMIRLALDTLTLTAILAALAVGLRLDLALDPCAADIDARPVTCPQ